MLSLWRRHTKDCPHREDGRNWTKCCGPVSCDGEINGRRGRQSLDTRDWARAGRKAASLESELESGRIRKTVDGASAEFLEQCSIEASTFKKYARWWNRITAFAKFKRVEYFDEIDLLFLDAYRLSRQVCALTWSKELQLLRAFFDFCKDRDWVEGNAAKRKKMPSDPKPRERRPYTSEEIVRILEACSEFGRSPYERLRARAMVLLMRYYGLRVSDVATLKRDRVKNGQIFVHALKNGAPIWLPLFPEVRHALDCLPFPQGAEADCPYYFWSGAGDRDRHITTIDRTLFSAGAALSVRSRIDSATRLQPKS